MTHSQDLSSPYSRILVATGGASHSQVAEQRAMHLAKQFQVPLEVVVVAPLMGGPLVQMAIALPGSEPLEAQATDTLLQERQTVLNRVLQDTQQQGIQARGHLIQSVNAAEAILQIAQQTGADLIVMGRRHLTALGAAFSGSTGDQVSHASGVDVLIAR
ncbi:universal stress protein [Deinococcus roseus]|uniref:Universal stress protein n=1 Tax=Deinococcus roseus TaxID=392414 RepID=A0ABQ2D4H3_9DEIO|nr:universal stress protein [Deinococcus roseus]GGJ38845.1 universal stress protein [Deinococcus roseus]